MRKLLVAFSLFATLCFAQEWEAVGGGMTSGSQIRDIWVDTLTDEVYVSGIFFEMGGTSSNGVAKWNGSQWIDLCPTCSNQQISSVLKHHDTLYIAGSFRLSNVPAYVARLTDTGWESIADVTQGCWLYPHGDSLFLMGLFDSIYGNPMPKVALRKGSAWVDPFPQDNFFDEPLFSYVGEMINYQGELIIGGNFDFGDISEITKYENSSWHSLGNGLLGNALIEEMVVYKGILYIGGTFSQSSGNAGDYLMAWNGYEFFNPFPEVEFQYNIRDLQVINDELYIISLYNYADDPTTYFFAKFDGENFCSFGGSFPSIFDVNTSPPTHIRGLNGELYVVCSPLLFNDTVNNIAHWLGEEMDTCIYSPVNALPELKPDQAVYQLHPNPAEDEITLHWQSQAGGKQDFVLYDLNGREVARCAHLAKSGLNQLTLELSQLETGTYLLDTGTKTLKIVKI